MRALTARVPVPAWMLTTLVLCSVLSLGVSLYAVHLSSGSQGVSAPLTLTNETEITVYTKTADGETVADPVTMPLWKYMQPQDFATASDLSSFKSAFEGDLSNHDLTFHLTHENIDGKKW